MDHCIICMNGMRINPNVPNLRIVRILPQSFDEKCGLACCGKFVVDSVGQNAICHQPLSMRWNSARYRAVNPAVMFGKWGTGVNAELRCFFRDSRICG